MVDGIVWLMDLQNPAISLQEKGHAETLPEAQYGDINTEIIDKITVHEKLSLLPPRERQIIVLRYIVQKSQEEVARILGLSQSHVSRLERQAIKLLKENK